MEIDEILPYENEMPPTYLITSSGDTLAKKQTIQLYELLKKNGVSCELANYGKEYGETLPHVFSVLQPFEPAGKDAIDKALAFYQNEMKQGLQSKDFLDNFHRIFNAARTSAEHGSGINAL